MIFALQNLYFLYKINFKLKGIIKNFQKFRNKMHLFSKFGTHAPPPTLRHGSSLHGFDVSYQVVLNIKEMD